MAIFFMLVTPIISWSAMTCSESGSIDTTPNIRITNLICTFDTTSGTAVYTLDSGQMGLLNDRLITGFYTIPGTTGPTINSDLTIADSRGVNIVSASINGLDVVDNSTSTGPFYGNTTGGLNYFPILHSKYPVTITVTNNAVNNSLFTLSIESLRMY